MYIHCFFGVCVFWLCFSSCLCSIQCPDSACKQDLLAYLQRIALYCHQLNICSKVKAEVQNLGGELIVSGVSWHQSYRRQRIVPRQPSWQCPWAQLHSQRSPGLKMNIFTESPVQNKSFFFSRSCSSSCAGFRLNQCTKMTSMLCFPFGCNKAENWAGYTVC